MLWWSLILSCLIAGSNMIYDLPPLTRDQTFPARQRALWIAVSLALKTIAGGIIALAKAIDAYVN